MIFLFEMIEGAVKFVKSAPAWLWVCLICLGVVAASFGSGWLVRGNSDALHAQNAAASSKASSYSAVASATLRNANTANSVSGDIDHVVAKTHAAVAQAQRTLASVSPVASCSAPDSSGTASVVYPPGAVDRRYHTFIDNLKRVLDSDGSSADHDSSGGDQELSSDSARP